MKIFVLNLFLILGHEVTSTILKVENMKDLNDRFLKKLNQKERDQITKRIQGCGKDQKCVKFYLKKGHQYL